MKQSHFKQVIFEYADQLKPHEWPSIHRLGAVVDRKAGPFSIALRLAGILNGEMHGVEPTLIICARIFGRGSFSARAMYDRSGRWPMMEA